MDAANFLKNVVRICNASGRCCECGCPLWEIWCKCYVKQTNESIDTIVKVVERWAEDHPVKTRLTEFLKMFPNVVTDVNGFPDPDPCKLDRENYRHARCDCRCEDCRRDYWLKEVE